MLRSGDIAIGPELEMETQDFTAAFKDNVEMFHNNPDQAVRLVSGSSGSDDYIRIRPHRPLSSGPCVNNLCFSSASLEHVDSIEVFNKQGDLTQTEGMIFTYSNGTRRAVGQCRPYVDDVYVYRKPTALCFQRFLNRNGHYSYLVHFAEYKMRLFLEQHNWKVRRMSGYVEVWFTANESWLYNTGNTGAGIVQVVEESSDEYEDGSNDDGRDGRDGAGFEV
jgi:hypothetical protein